MFLILDEKIWVTCKCGYTLKISDYEKHKKSPGCIKSCITKGIPLSPLPNGKVRKAPRMSKHDSIETIEAVEKFCLNNNINRIKQTEEMKKAKTTCICRSVVLKLSLRNHMTTDKHLKRLSLIK